jgi:adenosylcobyric acid synthase
MVKSIMIQGTMSNAGKSMITAGLCRIFAQDGYKVAPFKSQNISSSSYITDDGLEMGIGQAVQARAAYKKPDVRMNPVLLKPSGRSTSQIIVNGEVINNLSTVNYSEYKISLIPKIMDAYNSLAEENDIIVIEGAGSSAEINIKNDISNMGMAKLANSPVLIIGDIDRGGVFASLYGTYMLQNEEYRNLIKGTIINKFRGDVEILKPGIEMLEELINVPSIGVVPYVNIKVEEEDSIYENTLSGQKKADIDLIKNTDGEYDKLASLLRDSLNIELIYGILNKGV